MFKPILLIFPLTSSQLLQYCNRTNPHASLKEPTWYISTHTLIRLECLSQVVVRYANFKLILDQSQFIPSQDEQDVLQDIPGLPEYTRDIAISALFYLY